MGSSPSQTGQDSGLRTSCREKSRTDAISTKTECAADKPAAREIWVECQRTIDERYHGADVFAEIGQRLGTAAI